jgi:hypothetical protein
MYPTLEGQQADGRIIYLKWVFKKYVVSMLIGLSWLRIRYGGILLPCNEPSCSVKTGNFLTSSVSVNCSSI